MPDMAKPLASRVTRTAPDPYQAESDCNTLTRAADIQADPSRHRAARTHAKGQLTSLKRVVAKPMSGRR